MTGGHINLQRYTIAIVICMNIIIIFYSAIIIIVKNKSIVLFFKISSIIAKDSLN